jgi:hypothetical protein
MNLAQSSRELIIAAEFIEVETGGQNVGVGLGCHQAIADKGEAFVTHFEELAAFFGSEMNQKRKLVFDRGEGGFDLLKIGV